jgi:hypothetical protein
MTYKEQFLYAIRQRDDLLLLLTLRNSSHIAKAKKDDRALWRNVLIVKSPAGQISYHISPEELERFKHLPRGPNTWDGHDDNMRRERIMAWLDIVRSWE